MWTNTDVTRRLGLRVPIIQGPFGGGLSSVALTAAVSNAGGLGSFGVHHLSGADIIKTAQAIRSQTRAPFALNLWIPLSQDVEGFTEECPPDETEFNQGLSRLRPYFEELGVPLPERPSAYGPLYDEQVEALLKARPSVFSFVYGIPAPDILRRCKELDILTLGAATTPDEAFALEQAGVDLIVATGFEAGGHRVSFLRSAEESLTGTFSLIPQVVDRVKVPVIAAGGIADGRGIAAALALGAQAVQIGTAFLACRESGASEPHRRALFSPAAQYTGLTRVFSGRVARSIRNRLMTDLQAQEPEIPRYPVQSWLTGQIKAAAIEQDRADLISLWSGQAAPLLRHSDAAALMTSLVADATEVLTRLK